MRFDVLTLHPAMCEAPLQTSILGRAQRDGQINVKVHDLREWAEGKHRQADDTPYGGGAGMVMRVDVVDRGIQAVAGSSAKVLLMDPAGRPFTQADAERLGERSSWSGVRALGASTRASGSIWMRWCPLETLSSPGESSPRWWSSMQWQDSSRCVGERRE